MTDIFKIPLYYIGFKRNKPLENQLRNWGFTNINHFQAIDGRKLNPEKLFSDGIIGSRAYNDLKYGRAERSGISSLGTIGCTLSHSSLWKLCVDNNYPYIIIAEDDVIIKRLNDKDIKNIQNALSKENGAFIGANLEKGKQLMQGLHFYILSNSAAKKLYEKAFPIDIQTDCYVVAANNTNVISAEGYPIAKQKLRKSTTGDTCFSCSLPKSDIFYISVVIFIVVILILLFFIYKSLKKTKVELDSCRSSSRSFSD